MRQAEGDKNLESIAQLAERYTAELDAQFRTLNLFVQHAGEVGRAHEVFLRGVLARFLPRKLRCGSGFVVSERHVTRQQDIIIYNQDSLPVLFEVGDCLVVDAESVAGVVEVKTDLASKPELKEALEKSDDIYSKSSGKGGKFVGIYAWDGLSLDAALECYWAQFRAAADISFVSLPSAFYVRGKYLLVPNDDGRLESAPLLVFKLGAGGRSEGEGLLSLVERMWIYGIYSHAAAPWWISTWRRHSVQLYESVDWPSDLRVRVDQKLRSIGMPREST